MKKINKMWAHYNKTMPVLLIEIRNKVSQDIPLSRVNHYRPARGGVFLYKFTKLAFSHFFHIIRHDFYFCKNFFKILGGNFLKKYFNNSNIPYFKKKFIQQIF